MARTNSPSKSPTPPKESKAQRKSNRKRGSGTSPRKPTGPALEAGALDKNESNVNIKTNPVIVKEETHMSKEKVAANVDVATVVEAPVRATMKTVLPNAVSTRLPGFIGNTLDKVPARYGIPAIILIAGLFIVRKLAQDDGVVIDQPEDPAIKA